MSVAAENQSQSELRKEAVRRWWNDLADKHPGERAALRRCGTLTEIVFIPAYHRLYAVLAPLGWRDELGVAAIAGLASLVRQDLPAASVAQQMAQAKPGSTNARISGLRFRRLLKHRSHEELFPALGRIVRSLDGRINLGDLAESAYWWNDRTRRRWAFDYYDTAPQEQ